MKKYNNMLFLLLFTSGCKSNYISYLYIDNLTEMSTAYCESNKLSGCDKYRLCMSEQYDTVKSKAPLDLARGKSIIIREVLNIGSEDVFTHLIPESYGLLDPQKPDLNDLGLSVGVSYFIYAHNACASIIGDKTYNIDNYMPLLKKELGVK